MKDRQTADAEGGKRLSGRAHGGAEGGDSSLVAEYAQGIGVAACDRITPPAHERIGDLRVLRTVMHIVRPGPKRGMRPLSLGYLRLALRDKSACILFATFPKSGWNWITDVLSYCLGKHFYGSFEVAYGETGTLKQRERKPFSLFVPADSRAAGTPEARAQLPGLDLDYCLHTHAAWREAPMPGLDRARTVLLTRNIPTCLYSIYHHRLRTGRYADFEAFLESGIVDRALLFYNSWGRFAVAGARLRRIAYEDLQADPLAAFDGLVRWAFGLAVIPEVLAEAVDYYRFDRQKEREYRFCDDERQHFHFRGATDYRDLIAPATRDRLTAELEARLTHRFPHDIAP